jgi:hypothetical protein
MGEAPKIIEELRRTREQIRESERDWFLDPATGELKPEEDPTEDPQVRPKPVRVARQTFD